MALLAALSRLFAPRHAGATAPAGTAPAAAPRPEDRHLKAAHAALLTGVSAAKDGDLAAAVAAFQAAFIAFAGARDRARAAMVQKVIGLVLSAIKDPATADAAFARACDQLRCSGLYDEEARVQLFRARGQARRGRWDEANRWLREAASLYRRIGHVSGQIETLIAAAEFDSQRGKKAEAKAALQAARALAETEAQPGFRATLTAHIAAAEQRVL